MSRTNATERDPLLAAPNSSATVPGARPLVVDPREVKFKPGPLEITKSRRYAILSGIWTATFLSVCFST